MSVKRIFVDMDGVLSDFDKRYYELFKMRSLALREAGKHKEYRENWKIFISGKNFSTLDLHDGALELIEFLNSVKAEKAILSSTAGFEDYYEISQQKYYWLQKHKIDWTPIFVPGKRYKKVFSQPNTFLIDDTDSNIQDFRLGQGTAVLHKSAKDTISVLKCWLERENDESNVNLTKKGLFSL